MPVDFNIMTEKSGFVDYSRLHFGEYDYRDSSTFNFLEKKFDAVFGSGQWATDVVTLGKKFPVTKLRFGLITNKTYTTPDFFVPQIIGLGPLSREHSPDSILTTLSHRVRQKIFSVWVEPKSLNDSSLTAEASITFGDTDEHCYHYGAFYTKHVPAKYDGADTWGFRLDTIYINHKHYFVIIDVYETAAIATHPYYVIGPENALDQIAHELGAHKDGPFYFVECKRRAKLPDISFNIGKSEIWIGPEDYVIVDDEHDVPLCMLIFVLAEDRNSTTNSKWSFGIPILNRYCPLFDFGKNRVGFSQIKKDTSLDETHPRARYLSTFDDAPH